LAFSFLFLWFLLLWFLLGAFLGECSPFYE